MARCRNIRYPWIVIACFLVLAGCGIVDHIQAEVMSGTRLPEDVSKKLTEMVLNQVRLQAAGGYSRPVQIEAGTKWRLFGPSGSCQAIVARKISIPIQAYQNITVPTGVQIRTVGIWKLSDSVTLPVGTELTYVARYNYWRSSTTIQLPGSTSGESNGTSAKTRVGTVELIKRPFSSNPMTQSHAIDFLLANARKPMMIWVDMPDGKSAKPTALRLMPEDLQAMAGSFREAYDFAIFTAGSTSKWFCFPEIAIANNPPLAKLVAKLKQQNIDLPKAVDLSIDINDGRCLVCRPPIQLPGKATYRFFVLSGAYKGSWIEPCEFMKSRPIGITRPETKQCYVVRYDQFLDKVQLVSDSMNVAAGTLYGPGRPRIFEYDRQYAYFLVCTPTDRDIASRIAPELALQFGEGYLYTAGISEVGKVSSLDAGKAYLRGAQGAIMMPIRETKSIPFSKPSADLLAKSNSTEDDDPTAEILTDGTAIPLNYEAKSLHWDYSLENASVWLHDDVIDLAGSLTSTFNLGVSMRSKQPAIFPLAITFLIRLADPANASVEEKPEPLFPSMNPRSTPGIGGSIDCQKKSMTYRLELSKRSRRVKDYNKISLRCTAGMLLKDTPETVKEPFPFRDKVTKISSSSRIQQVRPAPLSEYISPWITVHSPYSSGEKLSPGWHRVTCLVGPDKQNLWIDGKPCRAFPTFPEKARLGTASVDPHDINALPNQAYWELSIHTGNIRMFIADLRVMLAENR